MRSLAIEVCTELHTAASDAAANTNREPEQRAWRALQAFAAAAIDDLESPDAQFDFSDEQPTRPGVDESPVTKPERVAELELELEEARAELAGARARIDELEHEHASAVIAG